MKKSAPKTPSKSDLLIQRDRLRHALETCLNALLDETGNVARREYDATVEARAALYESKGRGFF